MEDTINQCNDDLTTGNGDTAKTIEARKDIQNILKEMRKSTPPTPTQLFNKVDRSELGRAAFYRPYLKGCKAQWISQMWKANWSDPSNPSDEGIEKEPSKIATTLKNYYQSLYKAVTTTITRRTARDTLIDSLKNGAQVLPPTADNCSAPISSKETLQTLENLPLGKSAGPDRLPNAFYKTFSTMVEPKLTAVSNEARENGELPEQFRQGLISVLYNKKRQRRPPQLQTHNPPQRRL